MDLNNTYRFKGTNKTGSSKLLKENFTNMENNVQDHTSKQFKMKQNIFGVNLGTGKTLQKGGMDE